MHTSIRRVLRNIIFIHVSSIVIHVLLFIFNHLYTFRRRPLLATSLYIKSGNFSDTRENIKYVRLIHIHPEFNSTTLKNDIALLQVQYAVRIKVLIK